MMQSLPPPPPYHCIKAVDVTNANVKMLVSVSGDPAQVEAWLIDVKKQSDWKIDADTQSNCIRLARLSGPASEPYKKMGGLIYSGQVRHLSVSFGAEPPICESDAQ